MRNVVFGINITADGFCGHTDGIVDAELHSYFTNLLARADIILYGRTTYELMVPYWPDVARNQSDDESSIAFARVFDSLQKVVFSRTLKEVEDPRSKIARSSPAEEVRALKDLPGKDIAIGSLSLASQISEHGLIDEYHFVVHPVIAGKGPKLFDSVKLKERMLLDLQGAQTFRSGAVALHYQKRS